MWDDGIRLRFAASTTDMCSGVHPRGEWRTLRHRNFRGEWKIPPRNSSIRMTSASAISVGQQVSRFLVSCCIYAWCRITRYIRFNAYRVIGYPNFLSAVSQELRPSDCQWLDALSSSTQYVQTSTPVRRSKLTSADRGCRSAAGWVGEQLQPACRAAAAGVTVNFLWKEWKEPL